jgi:predicted dehydrogenase/threonine dehydrogenase-like Zn-dependent dehydrogenase
VKQVVQSQRGGKLRVADVPAPLLRSTNVIVQTAASLISAGTERSMVEVARKSLLGKALARPDQVRKVMQSVKQVGWQATFQKVNSRLDALDPLGYSAAGVVLAVGPRVRGIAVGDRVACAGAGYASHAEIIAVPATLCTRVPADVSFDDAAYATVGAIALQGVRQAEPRLGDVVGVIGLGLLGLITVQLLRANGCRVVAIDPDASRCDRARSFGADVAVSPSDGFLTTAVQGYGTGGLDAVIITAASTSAGPVELAGQLSRDRGRVVIVGAVPITVPRSPFYEREIEIRLSRSYGPGRYDPEYEEQAHDYPIGYVRWTEGRNLGAVLDLIQQGKLNVSALTTHRFWIEEAERAYAVIDGSANEPHLGVVLRYHEREAGAGQTAQPITISPKTGGAERVVLGVIGAGSFAQGTLLPPLAADSQVFLKTIATASGLSARAVAERLKFQACAADAAAVLADAEVNAVLVATRHDSHASFVAQAVAAGKAVFVEKPLAVDAEQLAQVAEAVAANPNALVMVGFNRRFAPLFTSMRTFFAGSPEPLLMTYRVNAGYIPPEHWVHDPVQGGGRIIGEVCHFVDLMTVLAGDQVVEVQAVGVPDGGRYRQDNVVATLRFSKGSVGTIIYAANGDRSLEKERLEVMSAGRSAVLEDFRALVCHENGRSTRKRQTQDKGHRAEIAAFVQAVKGGEASPVPVAGAIHVTEVTMAIVAALATGSSVTVGDFA